MYFVSEGSTELLKTLISAGADVNTEDKEGGYTALMYSMYQKEASELL